MTRADEVAVLALVEALAAAAAVLDAGDCTPSEYEAALHSWDWALTELVALVGES